MKAMQHGRVAEEQRAALESEPTRGREPARRQCPPATQVPWRPPLRSRRRRLPPLRHPAALRATLSRQQQQHRPAAEPEPARVPQHGNPHAEGRPVLVRRRPVHLPYLLVPLRHRRVRPRLVGLLDLERATNGPGISNTGTASTEAQIITSLRPSAALSVLLHTVISFRVRHSMNGARGHFNVTRRPKLTVTQA
jgi:hypothetical protein